MSKSLDFLNVAVLTDVDGNRAKIIKVRGSEEGLDHLEITTQSAPQKEENVATCWRLYNTEVLTEEGLQFLPLSTATIQ